MIDTIITHPGKAHRDDFLSCCLMLTKYDTIDVICRRDPTQAELEDENVLVIDVGRRLEPSKRNYDHHQLPRDADADCALRMIVDHELKAGEDFSYMEWYKFSIVLDSKGPTVAAESCGLNKFPNQSVSPVEGALLHAFGGEKAIERGDLLFSMMQFIGHSVYSYTTTFKSGVETMLEAIEPVSVAGLDGIILNSGEDLSRYLNWYRDKHPNIVFAITPDFRKGGFRLYRYDDHPSIDFCLLNGDPDVMFAHSSGFLAVVSDKLSKEELLKMIERSVKV